MATKLVQIGGDVAAALAAAQRANWVGAREVLCTAWRAQPSARIARIVAAIDGRLPREPIAGATVNERELAWHALALAPERDPAALSKLLHAPWPVHANLTIARLHALMTWPASPRISNAIVGLLASGTFTGATRGTLLRRIVTVLFRARDPAITEYLVAVETSQDRTLVRALEAKLAWKNRPEEPIFDEATDAMLRALETHLAPRPKETRERLIAAIYAAPHDDGPREVLADVLVEDNDAYGELIVMQLRRARGERGNLTRERALLREGGRAWYGDLDRDGATTVELARGFPARVCIAKTSEFTVPAWATVDTLIFPTGPTKPFVGSPHLRGLRRLFGVVATDLYRIVLPEPELDVLAIIGCAFNEPTTLAPRMLVMRAGRGVSSAQFAEQEEAAIRRLARVAVGRRVTHLGIEGTYGVTVAFELMALAPQLHGFTTGIGVATDDEPLRWTITFDRGALRCVWRGREAMSTFERLASDLKELPAVHAAKVTSLEVVTQSDIETASATAAKIRASVRAWPALTRSDIL